MLLEFSQLFPLFYFLSFFPASNAHAGPIPFLGAADPNGIPVRQEIANYNPGEDRTPMVCGPAAPNASLSDLVSKSIGTAPLANGSYEVGFRNDNGCVFGYGSHNPIDNAHSHRSQDGSRKAGTISIDPDGKGFKMVARILKNGLEVSSTTDRTYFLNNVLLESCK
jgi:hypothetical protein